MPSKTIAITLGVVGILIEIAGVYFIAQKTLPSKYGLPLVIAGMFLAFVPLFVLARMRKR